MKRALNSGKYSLTRLQGWCGIVVLASFSCLAVLSAQQAEAKKDGELDWQPKGYQFSRYELMLGKSPFGKVPVIAPPPAVIEKAPPVEEKQLAIAGVSVVEGKPIVYLIDLKTRAYQKINTEGENENKIRLVEINNEINPRDVTAEVMIKGQLSTVKYDPGILAAKPKQVVKRNGGAVNVAGSKNPPRVNPNEIQNGQPPEGRRGAAGQGGANTGKRASDIQTRRRLSAVPRRRVIVPGRSSPR